MIRGLGDPCPPGYMLDPATQAICVPATDAIVLTHAADDPNFSVTVSAKAPPAAGGFDAKTLGIVIVAAFLFAVVFKK